MSMSTWYSVSHRFNFYFITLFDLLIIVFMIKNHSIYKLSLELKCWERPKKIRHNRQETIRPHLWNKPRQDNAPPPPTEWKSNGDTHSLIKTIHLCYIMHCKYPLYTHTPPTQGKPTMSESPWNQYLHFTSSILVITTLAANHNTKEIWQRNLQEQQIKCKKGDFRAYYQTLQCYLVLLREYYLIL